MNQPSVVTNPLSESLTESVLEQLRMDRPPEPSLAGLQALYAAWCQRVPFDNVRKLIHVRSGDPGPLPGSTAEDFFRAWLKHGTGGTCWAGAGAYYALLKRLGFQVERGVGTMLVAPDLPPNHGSVCVRLEEGRYLVDCSILHGEPLRLDENSETRIDHPAWGVRCVKREGRWHVEWRPLHKVDGFECRLEGFGARHDEFVMRYAETSGWSPFNYEVTVRVNRKNDVVGLAFGQAVSLEADGAVWQRSVSHEERVRVLIEEIGMSEEIVGQLPEDVATPPPPWSRTAQVAAAVGNR